MQKFLKLIGKEEGTIQQKKLFKIITVKDTETVTITDPLEMSFTESTKDVIKFKFLHIKQLEDARIHEALTHKEAATYTLNEGAKESVFGKNRYANILPFDQNRVKISCPIDYINASFIKLPNNQINYIATQGPTKNTLGQFWQMVKDQSGNSKKDIVILMLTPLVEGKVKKCSLYWCNEVERYVIFDKNEYGLTNDLRLDCIDVIKNYNEVEGLNYTELQLDNDIKVHHFYFDQWTDFEKPGDWRVVKKISELVRQVNDDGPLITHCSAGVGRTGTFITMDYLFNKDKEELIESLTKEDLIYQTVCELRKQRIAMVQSLSQFNFCYDSISDYLK